MEIAMTPRSLYAVSDVEPPDDYDPWVDQGDQEPDMPVTSERKRSTWWPVDLGPFLDGSYKPPEPTIGLRSDGRCLFYPGRDHTVISESEGGKTWLAAIACLDEMQAGRHAVYVDFEGDAGSLVNRLLIMGAQRDLLAEKFHYVSPDTRLNDGDFAEIMWSFQPSLVILDGVTEGMSLHGFDPLDNKEVSLWRQMLTKRIMSTGAAVVSLDHVTKNAEGRGRYAIGGVHKINGLDGAAYVLENRAPFGKGLTGKSTIKIAKDRHGQLRTNGLPGGGGMHWYGDLVVKIEDGYAEASVEPPHEVDENWQPTDLMVKISRALSNSPQPLSQRVLLMLVKGKSETKREAFSRLIAGGYITDKTPHTTLKPYDPEVAS